jgi:hypothetical protein
MGCSLTGSLLLMTVKTNSTHHAPLGLRLQLSSTARIFSGPSFVLGCHHSRVLEPRHRYWTMGGTGIGRLEVAGPGCYLIWNEGDSAGWARGSGHSLGAPDLSPHYKVGSSVSPPSLFPLRTAAASWSSGIRLLRPQICQSWACSPRTGSAQCSNSSTHTSVRSEMDPHSQGYQVKLRGLLDLHGRLGRRCCNPRIWP